MIIIGRKSRNTDQALIKAGIELIAQGNYDPTVRAICTLANVTRVCLFTTLVLKKNI